VKGRLQRLLDRVAPVRPAGADRGYRRLLRWAALPVTDRRWAAPLAAAALGFGLFAGIAIGPGTTGTLATAGPQLIELPPLLSDDGEEEAKAEVEASTESGGLAESGGGGGEESGAFEFEASSSAYEEGSLEAEAPASEPASPAKEQASKDEAEPEEEAETMSGVVVHANPAAGSYTVVEAGGLMNAIHAAKLPAPGTKVSVPVRTVANGTFAEDGKRKQTGTRTSASLAGVVTFVDAGLAAPAYTVSKRGVSVLVHVRPDPAGVAPVLPQLGAYASVTVEIETPQSAAAAVPPVEAAPPAVPIVPPAPAPTCVPDPTAPPQVPAPTAVLWQSKLEADGAPFSFSDFEGVVTAICPSEALLAISGDDLRQSGKDILLVVPKSIDLTALKLGDSVAATAKIEADGTLTLTGLASDERTKGADDATATQGDLSSHEPK
jgi:hypothetical protein